MVDCTFCGQHAVLELGVTEARVEQGRVTLHLCEDCTEKYDEEAGISS